VTPQEARAQYPVLERVAYLNAGTNGPLAQVTVDAIRAQLDRDLHEGRSSHAYFELMLAQREEARSRFAALFGVEAETIALASSTTRGCNTVVAGLDLTPEDEIVTTDSEHFGLIGPLHASRARVVVAAPDEESILAALTPRTRLLAVSHVLWTTGKRLDVRRLREESGLPVLVDGAQSAGAIPVDPRGVDFYTVSAQKWLCAPEPSGALYVADPERLRIAAPSYGSQSAHEPSGAFTPTTGAARFDSGWINVPALAGLIAALDAHPDWRYEYAAEMAARCRELLAQRFHVEAGDATLVSFRPDADADETVARVAERGVVVRAVPGRGLVRVSCGYWTNDEDLARLLDALAAG
jgi:L-cysteine/cystine lyase